MLNQQMKNQYSKSSNANLSINVRYKHTGLFLLNVTNVFFRSIAHRLLVKQHYAHGSTILNFRDNKLHESIGIH